MNPFEFRKAWTEFDDNLRCLSLQTVETFALISEVKDFLSTCGLPESAAPFLNFVADINPDDKYDTINLLTDWFDFLEPKFSQYIVIGSDGCGDIIAINTLNNCSIEWLDHEDYFTSRFMNSSIYKMANCLLVYRQFISTVNSIQNEEQSLDMAFTDGQFQELFESIKRNDARAVIDGFWKEQLDFLIANREESREK